MCQYTVYTDLNISLILNVNKIVDGCALLCSVGILDLKCITFQNLQKIKEPRDINT